MRSLVLGGGKGSGKKIVSKGGGGAKPTDKHHRAFMSAGKQQPPRCRICKEQMVFVGVCPKTFRPNYRCTNNWCGEEVRAA